MKMHILLSTLLLSSSTLLACQDEAGVSDLVDEYIDQRNAQAEVVCDCHEELGYSDRSTCLRENGQVLPSRRRCIIDAFDRDESASNDYLSCYLPLEEEFLRCLDDRLTCDDFEAVSACVEDYNVGSRDCITLPASVERAYTDCL